MEPSPERARHAEQRATQVAVTKILHSKRGSGFSHSQAPQGDIRAAGSADDLRRKSPAELAGQRQADAFALGSVPVANCGQARMKLSPKFQ